MAREQRTSDATCSKNVASRVSCGQPATRWIRILLGSRAVRTLSLDRRRLKCTEYRTQASSEQALFWDEAAKWLQDSYVNDAIALLPTRWIEGRSLRAGTLSSISTQLSQLTTRPFGAPAGGGRHVCHCWRRRFNSGHCEARVGTLLRRTESAIGHLRFASRSVTMRTGTARATTTDPVFALWAVLRWWGPTRELVSPVRDWETGTAAMPDESLADRVIWHRANAAGTTHAAALCATFTW